MNNRTALILKMAREKGEEIPVFAAKGNDDEKEVVVASGSSEITLGSIQDMIENAEIIMDFGQSTVNSTFVVSEFPEQCSTMAQFKEIAQDIDREATKNGAQPNNSEIQITEGMTILEGMAILEPQKVFEFPEQCSTVAQFDEVAQNIECKANNLVQPLESQIQNTADVGIVGDIGILGPKEDKENDSLVPNEINNPEIKKKLLVRKKLCKPETWKNSVRKKLCQAGKEYISMRGKEVSAKMVVNKKDCLNSCKFQCSKRIGENARKKLFHYYYELSQNEKYVFLKQMTEKYVKGRKTTEGPSRRVYSFKYFFKVQEEKIQVCKLFFLGTLNISQKPVYTVHSVNSDVPKKDLRGKTGTRKLSDDKKQIVLDHIKKFNVVESHYCRHNSQRKYLESTLTIPKMYDLYLTYCAENNIENTVKLSLYRHIFCTNFNYSFHKPKKDVCETCSTYYLKKKESRISDAEEDALQEHIAEKEAMRKEKENDKKNDIPVLCFDLENVITCPRSFIGNHFYLQKLTMYNLTGHLSTTNKAYCAVWIETLQGRSGNCLASAFRKIIEKVLEENHITELITWSDSCVPQNRNSYISFCVLDILRNNPDLDCLTMKYSIPGHGSVQEVDNIHSQIERHLSKIEFFSPLGFIKELKQVNKKNPFVIIQMKDSDFLDYGECSKQMKYDNVPFTKVSAIQFEKSDLTQISFKKSHKDEGFQKVSISPAVPVLTRRRNKKTNEIKAPPDVADVVPKILSSKNEISKEKITALKKMMPSMPQLDQDFYKALLRL